MKRTAFTRKPPRRKVRAVRPGVTPKMPTGWLRTVQDVKARDAAHCRRCGHPVGGAWAVDHIIPRRLFENGAAASAAANLALLCALCHAYKTMHLEPALYGGNLLLFDAYCARLALSGPVPGVALRAAAFARLKELVYG